MPIELDFGSPLSALSFRFRWAKINTIKAIKASVPRATPTPIPALALVERPEDDCGVPATVAVGVPAVEVAAEVDVIELEVADEDVIRGAML